jgi:carbon storage regulator
MAGLALSRKVGEQILIDSDIKITVTECRAGRVRVSIEAPKGRRVLRAELLESKAVEAACGSVSVSES